MCDRLTTRPRKTKYVTETLTNDYPNSSSLVREGAPLRRDMTFYGESPREAVGSKPPFRPRTTKLIPQKASVLIGTWNVRTLREIGSCAQVAREMNRYKLSVLGMCETRWNTFGEIKLQTGETLLYSGKEHEDDPHEGGVALMLTSKAKQSLIEWKPISERIMTARFESKYQRATILLCYAPTNCALDEDKESFYTQLQETMDSISKRDMLLMGDLNAKVGIPILEENEKWGGMASEI